MSLPLSVVHVDNHLLVVDKPACVPSVPDESGDESLLDAARAWVARAFDKPGAAFLGVVQRLDRPVSGVMAFARTSKAASRLSAALREREVRKTYWGVTQKAPGDGAEEGAIEQWLLKDPAANRVRVVPEGTDGARRALTRWRVLERDGPACLLELEAVTGRPHQLRVALASVGRPLLGDLKYGAGAPLPDRSVALHAARLELTHPTRRQRLGFEVPPPPDAPWRFAACRAARSAGSSMRVVE